MSKKLCLLVLLFALTTLSPHCNGELSQTWYRWNDEINTISIHASHCSLEITSTHNNYMSYRTNVHNYINVNSQGNILSIDLSCDSKKNDSPPIVYLSIPNTEQYKFEILVSHSSVILPNTIQDLSIDSNEHSNIRIPLSNFETQSIIAEIRDDSHLVIDYVADLANFRMNCIILDEESYLEIDEKSIIYAGKGDYHYIKDDSTSQLDITLDSNSALILCSQAIS